MLRKVCRGSSVEVADLDAAVNIQGQSQVSNSPGLGAARFDEDLISVERHLPVGLKAGLGGFHCRNMGQVLG